MISAKNYTNQSELLKDVSNQSGLIFWTILYVVKNVMLNISCREWQSCTCNAVKTVRHVCSYCLLHNMNITHFAAHSTTSYVRYVFMFHMIFSNFLHQCSPLCVFSLIHCQHVHLTCSNKLIDWLQHSPCISNTYLKCASTITVKQNNCQTLRQPVKYN